SQTLFGNAPPRNSVSEPRDSAKQSFADRRSQTEFGNERKQFATSAWHSQDFRTIVHLEPSWQAGGQPPPKLTSPWSWTESNMTLDNGVRQQQRRDAHAVFEDSPTFQMACKQLESVAGVVNLDPGVLERLGKPKRALVVSVPIRM